MVTTFNKKDLVSFGKYLLSEGREKSLKQTNIEGPGALPYEERFRDIHDADIANWMDSKGSEKKPDRKVKVGDIVLYHPSTDQEYDQHTRNNSADVCPAIVTVAWSEECVNLSVFIDAADGETVPTVVACTSVGRIPNGTHNPQTGMWSFK